MTIFGILVPIILLTMVGMLLTLCILTVKRFLSPTLDCSILINEEKEVKGIFGATLLENLLHLGYRVPSPCGGKATCHQCKVKVLEGGGDPCDVETMVFGSKQIKEGWRLSCQCKLKKSVKVELSSSSINAATFEAKVLSNRNVSTFIKELCVELLEGQIKYLPGDYMQIVIPPYETHAKHWKETMDEIYQRDWHLYDLFSHQIKYSDEGENRAYSMASYPLEGKVLKFTVRIATPPIKNHRVKGQIPWGVGSSYLFSLKEGDTIKLSGPYGESHMKEDNRELVFLIGGAGASFARSHIFDLFYNKKTTRKVTLWYGARSLKENIYQEEFEKLASEFKNFSYKLVLSEPEAKDIDAGWPLKDPLKTGFACIAFEKGQLCKLDAPEDLLYYVCGPPMHNKTALKLLYEYGVDSSDIVLDDFGN